MMNKQQLENKKVIYAEIKLSWALRIGVFICGVVIALGLVSRLLGVGTTHGQSSANLTSQLLTGQMIPDFQPVSSSMQLFNEVLQWNADMIITVGLLLLIALPILRVAMTTFIFLHEKDWPFVFITLIVLSVLLSGIFFGHAL